MGDIPRTYEEFERQSYPKLVKSAVYSLQKELTKTAQNTSILTEGHVIEAIRITLNQPQLRKVFDNAMAQFHSPRVNQPDYTDSLENQVSISNTGSLENPSWANFDLADTLRPIAQAIAEHVNSQKNEQRQTNDLKNQNKLKNKMNMTPQFKKQLKDALELVIRAKPKQRDRLLNAPKARPF